MKLFSWFLKSKDVVRMPEENSQNGLSEKTNSMWPVATVKENAKTDLTYNQYLPLTRQKLKEQKIKRQKNASDGFSIKPSH